MKIQKEKNGKQFKEVKNKMAMPIYLKMTNFLIQMEKVVIQEST